MPRKDGSIVLLFVTLGWVGAPSSTHTVNYNIPAAQDADRTVAASPTAVRAGLLSCSGEYVVSFGAAQAHNLGMFWETVPWQPYSLISGIIAGGAAQRNDVSIGSTLRAINGLVIDTNMTATTLADVAKQGLKFDITFGYPCLSEFFNVTFPAQQSVRPHSQTRKRSKKRKQRRKTDWTALLHRHVINFADLDAAIEIVQGSLEFLELGRAVSVAAQGDGKAAESKVPLVTLILRTYNSMPLRRRPHKALLLARDLVLAGASVEDEAQTTTALHYAALCQAYSLVRSILSAGGNADALSSDVGGASPLHFILTLREPTVILTRELLMRNRAATLDQPLPSPLPLLSEAAEISEPMRRLYDNADVPRPLVLLARDVRLAIYHWQQALILSVLAHSKAPSKLLGARDFMGRTALHLASRGGNVLALDALFTRESVMATDLFGRSAYHLAAMGGHTDVIDRLNTLLQGVDKTLPEARVATAVRDPQGRTYQEFLPLAHLDQDLRSVALSQAEAMNDRGGWSAFQLGRWSSDRRCGIREVSGQMSAKDFVEGHLKLSRPVIMRGAARKWPWRMSWTKTKFQEKFGGRVFRTGSIPYPEIFGTQHENMSVDEYVRRARQQEINADTSGTPPYIFHEVQGAQDELLRNFSLFPSFLKAGQLVDTRTPRAVQFFLGAAGSGAPIHFHCDAWNVIAYGQKLWFLTPPNTALFSNTPILEWLRDEYDAVAGELTECVQEAGDIMYVPCEWAHAVLNLQETIGMAVEFTYTFNNLT